MAYADRDLRRRRARRRQRGRLRRPRRRRCSAGCWCAVSRQQRDIDALRATLRRALRCGAAGVPAAESPRRRAPAAAAAASALPPTAARPPAADRRAGRACGAAVGGDAPIAPTRRRRHRAAPTRRARPARTPCRCPTTAAARPRARAGGAAAPRRPSPLEPLRHGWSAATPSSRPASRSSSSASPSSPSTRAEHTDVPVEWRLAASAPPRSSCSPSAGACACRGPAMRRCCRAAPSRCST